MFLLQKGDKYGDVCFDGIMRDFCASKGAGPL